MSNKIFYSVANAAAYLGLSTRRITHVSLEAGVTPHNFGGPRVAARFMWTLPQLKAIQKHRDESPKRKKQRNAKFR